MLVNVCAMGREEGIWPEPDKFMLERFMGRTVDYKGRHFELIPFGAGCSVPGDAVGSLDGALGSHDIVESVRVETPSRGGEGMD